MRALAAFFAALALQAAGYNLSPTVPSTGCNEGDVLKLTAGAWGCGAASGGSAVPTGAILLIDSGTCPAGFAEVAGLSTRFPIGTVAANADVGGTGGSNTHTATGTNSVPTFTGAALAAHAHELPFQLAAATTFRPIAAATFGTGTSRAATGTQTTTANATSAAVALSQSVSAGTPAGTVSAPTFTGSGFDGRPAWLKVIYCKKT